MTGANPTAEPSSDNGRMLREELRLALVLNGGVSLAVWMGGVTRELDALVRAERAGNDHSEAYAPILELTSRWATVDVISGTSAGGINGACLALSLSNQNAKLGMLRDLWAEQGRMDNLLRAPFRGQPTSLLRGDEYFLPELTRAMGGLTTDFAPTGASVDLTITTTLLGGALNLTTDGLGQQLPQRQHGASFRFSTKHLRSGHNDFSPDHVAQTRDALGLASRCTAGFPFAFEPAFVPVETPTRGQSSPVRTEIDGRPNMWRWASWAERSRAAATYPDQAQDLSRYAVDGGLLANTPTREALDAIDRRSADAHLRRVMLLVFPHAPRYDPRDPDADPADRAAEAPTVTGAIGGLLSSLSSQGSLTFVEEIDAHNRRALGWRGGRRRVLDSFSLDDMYQLVETGWKFYGATRIQAAAKSLSDRVPRPDGWDYGRLVAAARRGQTTWRGRHLGELPYVPKSPLLRRRRRTPAPDGELPTQPALPTSSVDAPGWGWGTTVALGVADSTAEILFAAQQLERDPDRSRDLLDAIKTVSDARDAMLRARDAFDDWWWYQPGFGPVAPDHEYWALRLECYGRAMQPRSSQEEPDQWLDAALLRLHGFDGNALTAGQREAVRRALTDTSTPNPVVPSGLSLGDQTKAAVQQAVAALAGVASNVSALVTDEKSQPELAPWTKLLDEPVLDEEPSDDGDKRLLMRLLTLDAATWMLADADSPGTSQAIALAQLSLVIDHPWAIKSTTPDDKVAGSELNRFGGFLKQSWRINDWIWGRLDAAQMICRLVLEPARLLRINETTGLTGSEMVEQLVRLSYGDSGAPLAVAPLEQAAVTELNGLFNGRFEDRGYLPALARLAAYPIQQRIIVAELPALARAIQADRVAGGNERSKGEVFLAVEKDLLESLEAGSADLWRRHGVASLTAFDRAGIGREPLDEEARSDAMIQTAVTAAATLVTVADSDRFGPKILKPVTKALRGAALLPYWLVIGLLSGSRVTRRLALLGFAAGGVALLLGLFGILGAFSAAGTTIGAGVVVGAFAFAALRSGTLLHGLVLLGASVPLVTLAAPAMRRVPKDDGAATGSVVSLGTVGVIVLGLILLASLPNPVRSPLASITRPLVWLRRIHDEPAFRRRLRQHVWGLVRPILTRRLLLGLGVVALTVLVLILSGVLDRDWTTQELLAVGAVGTACTVGVGSLTGWRRGRGMRRWTKRGLWEREAQVTEPSGVSAGWAAVYGAGYATLAWIAIYLLGRGPNHQLSDADTWQVAAVAWWAVLAALLCVPFPTWVTWRARRRVELAIAADGKGVDRELTVAEFREELERHGRLFDYMVASEWFPIFTERAWRLRPRPAAEPPSG